MTYFRVTASNRQYFRTLAPSDILERIVWDRYTYGIGASLPVRGEEKEIPVGILVFSREPANDRPAEACLGRETDAKKAEAYLGQKTDAKKTPSKKAEPKLATFRHLWIYVAPGYRGEGIGTELVNRFFRVLKGLKTYRVLADILYGGERDWLVPFYEGFSFSITRGTYPVALVTVKQATKSALFRADDRKDTAVWSVSEVESHFAAFVERLPEKKRRQIHGIQPMLDKNISCVCFLGDTPTGIFLVIEHGSGILEPMYLEAKGKTEKIRSKNCFAMLCFAAENVKMKFLPIHKVLFRLSNERIRYLCAMLYPDLRSLAAWHGEAVVTMKE